MSYLRVQKARRFRRSGAPRRVHRNPAGLGTSRSKYEDGKGATGLRAHLLSGVVVVLGAMAPWLCDAVYGADPTDDRLVSMVINAIEANYSQIETARVVFHETHEDPTVEEDQELTSTLPGGGQVTVWKSPRRECNGTYLLRGDDVRVELDPVKEGGPVGKRTFLRKDGVWTQYVPGKSQAWIRRQQKMANRPPLDLRELASDGVRRGVIDLLREEKVVSARLVDHEGRSVARVVVEKSAQSQRTYEFAAEENFLPTRVYTERRDDDSLIQVVDIEYEDVLDGRAKFVRRMDTRFFAKGATKVPTSTDWRKRITLAVLECDLNTELDERAFVLDVAIGTRVVDSVKQKTYRTQPPPRSRSRTWWWMCLGATGLFLCLLALLHRALHS